MEEKARLEKVRALDPNNPFLALFERTPTPIRSQSDNIATATLESETTTYRPSLVSSQLGITKKSTNSITCSSDTTPTSHEIASLSSPRKSSTTKDKDDLGTPMLKQTNVFTPYWQLPEQLPVFTGRKQQLAQLQSGILQDNNRIVIQHSQKISGSGGIGKTQLAIEFAHHIKTMKIYDQIIWINADISHPNILASEFYYLAKALNIDQIFSNIDQLFDTVYTRLSVLGKTLLIIDNADAQPSLNGYLPKAEHNISVIITTRDARDWSKDFTAISVDIFDNEEARSYIVKILPTYQDKWEEVDQLAKTLGYFPLALSQAIAYIKTRNIDITTYLNLYSTKKNQCRLLDIPSLESDSHQESIWVTLNICLEKIEKIETKKIISCSIFLAPEFPIHKHLIRGMLENSETANNSIDNLLEYSLFEMSKTTEFIKIHRMVQDVLKLTLDEKELLSFRDEMLIRMLAVFDECDNYVDMLYTQHDHIIHMKQLLEFLNQDQTIAEDKSLLYKQALLQRNLCVAIGGCYGDNTQALEYAKLSYRCFIDKFPDNLKELSTLSCMISEAYYNLQNYQQSEHFSLQSYQHSLPIVEGNRHLVILPLIRLATVYMDLGKYDLAKSYIVDAVEQLERSKNLTIFVHYQTAVTLANLWSKLGETAKSMELYKSLLDRLNDKAPIDPVSFTNIYSGYSKCLISLGDFLNAHKYTTHIIDILIKFYGPKYPPVVQLQYDLLIIEFNLENYSQVIEKSTNAIRGYEQLYPQAKHMLSLMYCNLGAAYLSFDNYDEAYRAINSAIDYIKDDNGPNRVELVMPLVNLSGYYINKEDWPNALLSLARAKFISETAYPENHFINSYVYRNIAHVQKSLKNFKQAVSYLEKATAIVESHYKLPVLPKAEFYTCCGVIYREVGDYHRSLDYLNLALLIYSDILTTNNYQILNVHLFTGYSYEELDSLELALDQYRIIVDITTNQEIKIGTKAKIAGLLLDTCNSISRVTHRLGKSENRLVCNLAQRAHTLYSEELDKHEPRVILARYSLAEYQEKCGDYSLALDGYTQVSKLLSQMPKYASVAESAQQQADVLRTRLSSRTEESKNANSETENNILIPLIEQIQGLPIERCFEILLLLIETCIAQHHLQKASHLLEIARIINTDNRLYFYKAKLCFYSGQFREAKTALGCTEHTMSNQDLAILIKTTKKNLRSIRSQPIETTIRSQILYSKILREHYQVNEALIVLNNLDNQSCDSKAQAAIHYNLALTQLALEDYASATKEIELSLDLQFHSKALELQQKIQLACQHAALLDEVIESLREKQHAQTKSIN